MCQTEANERKRNRLFYIIRGTTQWKGALDGHEFRNSGGKNRDIGVEVVEGGCSISNAGFYNKRLFLSSLCYFKVLFITYAVFRVVDFRLFWFLYKSNFHFNKGDKRTLQVDRRQFLFFIPFCSFS